MNKEITNSDQHNDKLEALIRRLVCEEIAKALAECDKAHKQPAKPVGPKEHK